MVRLLQSGDNQLAVCKIPLRFACFHRCWVQCFVLWLFATHYLFGKLPQESTCFDFLCNGSKFSRNLWVGMPSCHLPLRLQATIFAIFKFFFFFLQLLVSLLRPPIGSTHPRKRFSFSSAVLRLPCSCCSLFSRLHLLPLISHFFLSRISVYLMQFHPVVLFCETLGKCKKRKTRKMTFINL